MPPHNFCHPAPMYNETKHNVSLTIDIWDIVEINERDGFFRCTHQITRKWIDRKVTFQNLQRKIELNLINPEDRSLLWMPWTIYKNIEDRAKIAQTDTRPVWKVIPNSNFSYSHADKTFLHNTYLFDGTSSLISYEASYTTEFLCNFQMAWFPFDTQSCTMELHQAEDSIQLVPESVHYTGHELPQHFIRNITMCTATVGGKEGIIVEIILGRPLSAKFLTVIKYTASLTFLKAI